MGERGTERERVWEREGQRDRDRERASERACVGESKAERKGKEREVDKTMEAEKERVRQRQVEAAIDQIQADAEDCHLEQIRRQRKSWGRCIIQRYKFVSIYRHKTEREGK